MKAKTRRIFLIQLVFLLLFTQSVFAQQQGRVVINEYMSWTSNGCGTTSEFVELLNFGPGPVDISCYIVTTGIYSITIPKTTILQPGQFYVIAGQNFISGTCANIDSSATGVTANLNWSTCNCTNIPIPTTGDGMLKDGGTSNTPLVLLDPSLNIIDAVVRDIPTEAVGTITSASAAGGCTSSTFNIGTMNPSYEVLGMSGGRGNSYARTLDGDCNWVKETEQSGGASNNRSGRTTDITYEFDMLSASSCSDVPSGSVSIYVKHSNYAAIFPMFYAIVRDSNNNGEYDFNDHYQIFYDSDPPFIEIDNLPIGRFRVTVGSVKGCYLENFDFSIVSCSSGTLPVRLVSFKNNGSNSLYHHLEWLLQDVENLQSIVVEKGVKDGKFVPEKIFAREHYRGSKLYSYKVDATTPFHYYRLKITQKDGKSFYSPVIHTDSKTAPAITRIGPNPASDKVNVEMNSAANGQVAYTIYDNNGLPVSKGHLTLKKGDNSVGIPVQSLSAGVYQMQVAGLSGTQQPISMRFVKH